MGEAVPAEDDAAPLDLARLLRGVEEEGREFVLTRGGRPVARPAPERAAARRALTPEQEADAGAGAGVGRIPGGHAAGLAGRRGARLARRHPPRAAFAVRPTLSRPTLDTNGLGYASSCDARRHGAAVRLVAAAARVNPVLTLQALGAFFHVVTRKRLASAQDAMARVRELQRVFGVPAAACERTRRLGMEAAASRRFSFRDAMLLATAAESGCADVVSEDMAPGAALVGVRVVPAFDGSDPHPDALAILAAG